MGFAHIYRDLPSIIVFFLPGPESSKSFRSIFSKPQVQPKWKVDILVMIWVFPKIGVPQMDGL